MKFLQLLSGKQLKAIQYSNNPSNLNPFATMADINANVTVINVANYSALPDPTTVPNKFYRTLAGESLSWRPIWLGGTYKPEGIYQSLGGVWDYVGEFPYQATEAEALAGTNDSNFITPFTLKKVKSQKLYSLNFLDYTTTSFVAPYDLKILSIGNVVNSPTVAILNGALVYTLGTTVTAGSIITVTVSTASYINLNIEQL